MPKVLVSVVKISLTINSYVCSVRNADPYEDYPDDEDRNLDSPETTLEIATKLKALGNERFKAGKVEDALDKWQSASKISSIRILSLSIPIADAYMPFCRSDTLPGCALCDA